MALNTAQLYPLRKLNLLALLLASLLCGFWPRAALAQDAAQQVLDAINASRAENGLSPLGSNSLLNQAAQNHVNDMLTNYVYGHYGSDGSTVQVRVARTGYSATPWVSENWVSAGDAGGAMRWWMSDYIHRVNILTARWTEIGVGVGSRGSELIFVTVFSAGGGSSGDTAAIAAGTPPEESPPPPSIHIEQLSVPPEGLAYTVVGGDTLLAIGLRYGLPWERIAEANGLDEHSLLQIGQGIQISGSGVAVAPPQPDVETEDYTVQPNDTLFSIAAKRGMYWDEVAVVNGFGESTVLQIGQVIRVPVVEEEVTPEPVLLVNSQRTTAGPVVAEQSAENFANYTLMKFDPNAPASSDTAVAMSASTGIGGPTGEVEAVAMAQSEGVGAASQVIAEYSVEKLEDAQVAVTEIAAANVAEAAPEPTDEGEASLAAVTSAAPATASEVSVTLYEVQPGDTIISIAVDHDLEWGPLLALNGLSENSVLQLGQVIRLR